MSTLRFAKGLALPTDAVTQKFAFLGRTGSGKTYGAKRLVESLLMLRAQVVILDPVGIWHGLRVGERTSFEIPVLGGLHGDLPLSETSGAVVARIVCERSTSMVLDVSQMRDAERTRFASAFAVEFFQLKKAAPSPVMLVLEELQEFAPQNPNPGEQMMLHEFQRIAKLGRNFGIGILGISQRPQECSKKLLNQTECVVAFQMTGPQERKALEYWLSDRGIESKDLGKLLPTLEVGKPLLWSPQWLKRREVVEILPIDTSDTSRTPKFGTVASTFQLRPIDVAELRAKLEAETEDAVGDDKDTKVKVLQERIRELQKTLEQRTTPTTDPKKIQALMRVLSERLAVLRSLLSAVGNDIETLLQITLELRQEADAVGPIKQQEVAPATEQPPRSEPPAPRTPQTPAVKEVTGGPLGSGELGVLKAIANKRKGANRPYLVLATGLRRASVETYVNRLVSKGYVSRRDGYLFATAGGFALLPPTPTKPLTGHELVRKAAESLSGGERAIFENVVREHPNALGRGVIQNRCGLAAASVETYVNRLVTRGYLVRSSSHKRCVELSPEFFS